MAVDLQDVLLDPQAYGLMHAPEDFRPETLRLGAFLEALEKHHEHFVGLFVFHVGRAPVTFHALLLELGMLFRAGFEKIDQPDQEFAFLAGRIGIGQHAPEVIDVKINIRCC